MGTRHETLEQRVEAFRRLVYSGIRKAHDRGYVFREYEGAVALYWPPFIHAHSTGKRFVLRLSCSVLGGETSHYAWRGKSWRAVFAQATEDVELWISQIGEDK